MSQSVTVPRVASPAPVFDGVGTRLLLPEVPAAGLPLLVLMEGQAVGAEDYQQEGVALILTGDYSTYHFDVHYYVTSTALYDELAALLQAVRGRSGTGGCGQPVTGDGVAWTLAPTLPVLTASGGLPAENTAPSHAEPVVEGGDCTSVGFGFPDAALPGLLPLVASHADNPLEVGIKQLVLDVWCKLLARRAFDANVLGAVQLGSFALVQSSLSRDGLVLAKSDGLPDAIRYLYKAWVGRNGQGRGLHFLRTYLQLQFGTQARAHQLWQPLNMPYLTGLRRTNNGRCWLTSRLAVEISDDVAAKGNISQQALVTRSVLESVVPARLVPVVTLAADASVDGDSLKAGAAMVSRGMESTTPTRLTLAADGQVRRHTAVAAWTHLREAA